MGFPLADCRNGCQKKNVHARPCHHFQGHSSPPDAHTGNRTPVTRMEGLYDATTLCVLAMWVKSCMLPSCLSFTKHHHPVQLRCPASSTHPSATPTFTPPHTFTPIRDCGVYWWGTDRGSAMQPGQARPCQTRPSQAGQAKPDQARPGQTNPDQARPGQARPETSGN